jgi:hypothetical protein
MTTAVLRNTKDADEEMPQVLAYAPSMDGVPARPHVARMTAGIPLPQMSPAKHPVAEADPVPVAAPAVSVHDIYQRLPAAALTMTKLDTQGLRLWSAWASTREKRYALMTMPDFGQTPSLLDKPTVTYAQGFGASPYGPMRTDSFAGALVQPPSVVDLTTNQVVAAQ